MRNTIKHNRLPADNRGFSLLEVLLGITVFMVGMLGVTALNISSMKSNTFSGNLSEATIIGASKLEELLIRDFEHPSCPSSPADPAWALSYVNWIASYPECLLSDRDNDGNRIANQDADDDGADDGGNNFGLDEFGADADYGPQTVTKNNNTYNVYWNVAENEPISIDPQRTKRITVIVEWFVKAEPRRISMSTIRQKES